MKITRIASADVPNEGMKGETLLSYRPESCSTVAAATSHRKPRVDLPSAEARLLVGRAWGQLRAALPIREQVPVGQQQIVSMVEVTAPRTFFARTQLAQTGKRRRVHTSLLHVCRSGL